MHSEVPVVQGCATTCWEITSNDNNALILKEKWREKYKKGSDFTMYSDIEIREVDESWIIEVDQ